MTFELLHQALIANVRQRVRNGDITERSLARLTGVSQPHIHNVLKGVRILSNHLADAILLQLKINVGDLTGNSQKEIAPLRSIPLIAGLLGQETGEFDPGRTTGIVSIPALVTANLWRPVMARLGYDPEARPRFEEGDLVLIDQAARSRDELLTDGIYVVSTTFGPRLRYVRNTGDQLFLVAEAWKHLPERWVPLDSECGSHTEFVRGRAIWVSRALQGF